MSLPATPEITPPCDNPHVDGCPECVLNTEPPDVLRAEPDGCVAWYVCADCGHHWETAWGCA